MGDIVMSFDSEKINQMVKDKQEQAPDKTPLTLGAKMLVSQCVSVINSEKFEDKLQKVLEEIITNEYNPSNSNEECRINYCFDYGIYLTDNYTKAILFVLLTVGVGTHCSDGALINEKVEIANEDANIGILNDYNSNNPMQKGIEDVQNELEEKIKDLRMHCFQTKFEDGSKNNKQSQDYLYGYILIGNSKIKVWNKDMR
jgi:hypothetical protein